MTEQEISEEIHRRFDRDYPNGWSGSQEDFVWKMRWYRKDIEEELKEQKSTERKEFWKKVLDQLAQLFN